MIEVGEYIRTNTGKIDKFKEVKDNWYYNDKGFFICFERNIVKHSFNIIDLIEVGDFVNYERILDITGDYILTTERNCCKARLQSELKSIVTKENFSEMEYRINE